MKLIWTQHLKTPEERAKFRQTVQNSRFVLDRLIEICYNIKDEAAKSSKDDYKLTAWPYYQADKLGYQRALTEIIEILQLDPKETT